MNKLTLLIDADILAYQAAAGAETAVNWGGDTDDDSQWTLTANMEDAQASVRTSLDGLMARLDADDYAMCLSDAKHNWRKDVLPTYKHNRTSSRKPIALPAVRQFIRDEYGPRVWERPSLEGDDLLGILSGLHEVIPGDKVMVTLDKDLSCIPGLHYRMHRDVLDVFEVSVPDADRWHLMQGIAGDPTDGYSGCPGWGMKSAEEFLNEPYMLVEEKFTQHKGKYAGVERSRWVKQPSEDIWQSILSIYAKEGVSATDAIVQFQVARILRADDYDFQNKVPILWLPKN